MQYANNITDITLTKIIAIIYINIFLCKKIIGTLYNLNLKIARAIKKQLI